MQIEERKQYLIKILIRNENPNIDTKEKLNNFIILLLDNWGVFDYFENRLDTCKTKTKHKIIIENSEPIRQNNKAIKPNT